MENYRISYVVTTYNKLPYLQQVISRIVAARLPDEEIVVVDGNSKDGTPEYLRGLFDAGHIQQFVSERDKGESHGLNKGMLLARGELIKIMSDDDAFCIPAIRQAADFMVAHPQVDVMSGETWMTDLDDLAYFSFYKWSLDHFELWRATSKPGTMIGLPTIIRRTSLALTGLFNTNLAQPDGEFSLRITSLKANIAWITSILSVRIENPQSNARNLQPAVIEAEVERMLFFHDPEVQHDLMYYLRAKSKLMKLLKKPLTPIKKFVLSKVNKPTEDIRVPSGYVPVAGEDRLTAAFRACDEFMAAQNAAKKVEFLYAENLIEKVSLKA